MPEKTILLVEDNPDDQELALHAFKANGILNPVVIAHDGVEALDYLFTRGLHAGRDGTVLPALTLLDLQLPKLDGLEVLARIRADERMRFLPVVILTSSKEPKDVLRSYSLGANSYIRKPVDFAQFTSVIGQLGQYWLGLNEPPPGR